MRLLKRQFCPIGDLHNSAKQCQCVNRSAEADTPYQVRHHNVPIYLSFFPHLPFILLSFPIFLSFFISSGSLYVSPVTTFTARFSPYYENCALHNSKTQHGCRWLWHSNSQQRRKLRQYENVAMQATKYITSHGASQHTGTYTSDVINRTYNQWDRTSLNINRRAVIHTGLHIPCNKSKASDLL